MSIAEENNNIKEIINIMPKVSWEHPTDLNPQTDSNPKHFVQIIKFIISNMCKDIDYTLIRLEYGPYNKYSHKGWYIYANHMFFNIKTVITGFEWSEEHITISIIADLTIKSDSDNNQENGEWYSLQSVFDNLNKSMLQNIIKEIYDNNKKKKKCWMALEGLDLEEMLML